MRPRNRLAYTPRIFVNAISRGTSDSRRKKPRFAVLSGGSVSGNSVAAKRNREAIGASAADAKRRSVQNFVAAVRLKNALTFRVVEQVRHYGFLPDPSSARYDALDAAIGELAAIATQLETETQASLNEDYWTSDLGLLGRLRNVRARLDEFPDVQRYSIAAATVPAAAPSTVARSKPREITDRQPAQWVDLYLKLARLSTRVESGSPPDDVALVSAAGPSNTALAEHADRIRRIAAGEVPRAEARDYW